MNNERKPNRTLYLKVTFYEGWEDYEDVHPELLFEDSGIMDVAREGVAIEIIETPISPEPPQEKHCKDCRHNGGETWCEMCFNGKHFEPKESQPPQITDAEIKKITDERMLKVTGFTQNLAWSKYYLRGYRNGYYAGLKAMRNLLTKKDE